MRTFGWALALVLLSCSSSQIPTPHSTPHPAPAPTPSETTAHVATPNEGVLTDAQRAELKSLLGELAKPPLGTGAALTVSTGGQVETFTEGSLFSKGPAVSAEDRFNVMSVSKLFTTAKVLALAHEGRLRRDDTVRAKLPGVALVDPDGKDRAAEVTVEQLLTHRAGLPHHPGDLDLEAAGTGWQDPDIFQKLTKSWSLKLVHAPGRYQYSNLGYVLLGAMIERLEQCSFADCMKSYMTELELPSATFLSTELASHAAHGRVVKDGEPTFLPPKWYASRYALPYGGLWTSMPDLARFGQHLVAASKAPDAALHAMTVAPSGDNKHGIGAVHRVRHGEPTVEHDGGGPGFLAWLVVIPERDTTIALACNGFTEGSKEGSEQFGTVAKAIIDTVMRAPD